MSATTLTPLLLALLLVLALIPAAAWLLRRAGLAQARPAGGLRVVAQLPLGPRERLVIVQVADRRWLLGVGAAGITRLGTLPAGDETPSEAASAAPGRGFADILHRLTGPR